MYLKDYKDEKGNVPKTEYFEGTEREGCTWSIQARGKSSNRSGSSASDQSETLKLIGWNDIGRFLKEMNANDVLFGNIFDRPLPLPHGSGVAVKFMHYTDPTLEDDLYCEKPWALYVTFDLVFYITHQTNLGMEP